MSTITPGEVTPAVNAEPTANTESLVTPSSPFANEREVLYDAQAIRDELSQAQSSPTAARKLSARHFSRLIYSLQFEPGAVERHTAPYSTSTE
jgi:hypothetical protein